MILVFYILSYFASHFCKASRKSLKPFSSYRKALVYDLVTIYNVHRGLTPKAGISELHFLCFAHSIMVIYICLLFQESISSSFKLQGGHKHITEITIFKVQRAITPKVGYPELQFLCSALNI